eukprot:CAMPEP_0194537384 /NCGR_PEP_ID=MMETSP0253-20130528/76635_1 /TAXON_ID=2966 /ORGANISM="Noctiluca scintillans" /LENGTH=99 /DNA_ID=CAMNT_0039383401 /DNA_START=236 /DNA_END=535 /DNA_ORIENTATION=-
MECVKIPPRSVSPQCASKQPVMEMASRPSQPPLLKSQIAPEQVSVKISILTPNGKEVQINSENSSSVMQEASLTWPSLLTKQNESSWASHVSILAPCPE